MALAPIQFSGRSLAPDISGGIMRGQQIQQGQNVLEQQRLGLEQQRQQAEQLQAQQAQLQQQQALARQLAERKARGETIETGADLAKLFVDNPQLADVVTKSAGAITEFQVNDLADFGFQLEQAAGNPQAQQQLIEQRILDVQARGGNPRDTASLLQATPEQRQRFARTVQLAALSPKERLEIAKGGKTGLASAKTEILPDGSVIQALPNGEVQVKDPSGQVVTGQDRLNVLKASQQFAISQKREEAEISVDAETKKAAAKAGVNLKAKPEIEAAVKSAVDEVKKLSEIAEEKRSNEVVFNTYKTAMKGLVDSLTGTDTGPFVGLLPAITSNQQIAEGAVAAMAPVLKSLFRSAGEGTFTDKDQELLVAMVPTRKDSPAARKAKIENIDAIVRSKLGFSAGTEEPSSVIRFDAQGNPIQ